MKLIKQNEKTIKEIISLWSYTCANIYARIIEEICTINREPKALMKFSNELYQALEEDDKKDFYVNANLGNIEITDNPKDIDDPLYAKENHYYHFFVDENENANFIEIEIERNENMKLVNTFIFDLSPEERHNLDTTIDMLTSFYETFKEQHHQENCDVLHEALCLAMRIKDGFPFDAIN